jgi:hypothetical protein
VTFGRTASDRRDGLEIIRSFHDPQGHRRTVAPGLLRVLAQVQRHFRGRQLHLMSGHRVLDDHHA